MQRLILGLAVLLATAPLAAAGGYANARYLDSYDYCYSYAEDHETWNYNNDSSSSSRTHSGGEGCSSTDDHAYVATGDDDGEVASARVASSDWESNYSYFHYADQSNRTGPNSGESTHKWQAWDGISSGSYDVVSVNSRLANASVVDGCYHYGSGGSSSSGQRAWSWDEETGYSSHGSDSGSHSWYDQNSCRKDAYVNGAGQSQYVGWDDGCYGQNHGSYTGTDESDDDTYHRESDFWSAGSSSCGRTASAAGSAVALGSRCQQSGYGEYSYDYDWVNGWTNDTSSSTSYSSCDSGAFVSIPNGTLFVGTRSNSQTECAGSADDVTCETTEYPTLFGVDVKLWETPAGPVYVTEFVPLTP